MSSKDLINPDRPGRKSSIQRLVYRPPKDNDARTGRKAEPPARTWSFIKDQLRRTVERAPEVVINVKGGGTTSKNVLRYMLYISRQGKLQVSDEKGERLAGKDAIVHAHDGWDLDLQRRHHRVGKSGVQQLHQSFNIVFSMPASTDSGKLLCAVEDFARDHFIGRQYIAVLHTPETDPQKDAPPHPHVHVIVRAEDDNGVRLTIRKNTLRAWREAFAERLRAHGIQANATSRAERGVPYKNLRGVEFRIRGRGDPSTALAKRLTEAARELQAGNVEPKPWELAMAARRRDELRKLKDSELRLRAEGDIVLADKVAEFVRNMPPLDTERHRMQRLLAAQVNQRLAQQNKDKDREQDR